ncbi:hypothetical protein PHLCEN_2v4741 [Hermanssonia centrifuga]|uniref:Uncharacterized protein n=1 Tax=Hermanssonia centrifuga TaxID=98765 RepID=A0A2R6PJZ4_9APHY|nr:hypothetical protein PHLCEN_2v4741 [Hermanssonia centrifuga]
MSSSPKPSSPPPAYTEVDPTQLAATTSRPPMDSQFSSTPSFPTHAGYGPTPLAQQQTELLPYYDPRSPHSVSVASSRARWRFAGALLWAIAILMIMSVLMGFEMEIQRQPWRGNLWRRMTFGNADEWRDQ